MNPLQKTLLSFRYAARGLSLVIRLERNARIHLAATGLAIAAGFHFQLDRVEWALIAIAIGGVWATEIMNTAIEKLVDHVSPEFHPQAGMVKDLAAAAVLITAILAVVLGGVIFGPRLI